MSHGATRGSPDDSATSAFRDALACAGGIDLLRATIAVGRIADPALDLYAVQREFSVLAGEISDEVAGVATGDALQELNAALFTRRGFSGDDVDYYDPRNCYLHETLQRRCGLPITLSILYIEVGRRCGLALDGLGFPGHFIVRAGALPATYRYVDPFYAGRELSRDHLAALLARQGGDPRRQLEMFLAAITPRQILTRVLTNLKLSYCNRSDYALARRAVDLLLVLTPWALEEIRDRGLLSGHLGDHAAAREDLEAYLERSPGAPDTGRVRAFLDQIRPDSQA